MYCTCLLKRKSLFHKLLDLKWVYLVKLVSNKISEFYFRTNKQKMID
jgi:hypothetical protein